MESVAVYEYKVYREKSKRKENVQKILHAHVNANQVRCPAPLIP